MLFPKKRWKYMAKDKQAELQKTIEELALETELFEGRCQDSI